MTVLDLFTPDDIILSCNLMESHFKATPERRLWVRVLEFTIEDLCGEKKKILKWIESDDFKFICKAVGCRPKEAAKHLRTRYGI